MKRRSFIIMLSVSPLVACYRPEQQLTLTGAAMGTSYHIALPFLPAGFPSQKTLQTEIDQLLAAINQSMSTYDENSELSRFNNYPETDWVEISQDLLTVLQSAQDVSKLSTGAFDMTIGPLVNLWGFGPALPKALIPKDAVIAKTKDQVGYQQLQIDITKKAARKNRPGISVDLSSIAKGYGVDKIAELLEVRGITDYMVEIGGDMRVSGQNKNHQHWRIAVEEPAPSERKIQKIIHLKGKGIATSGDYRNFLSITVGVIHTS